MPESCTVRFHVRTGAYLYGNVAAYVASGRQRRKALTVPAKKTPCISAIDTTNFARQIVLDFEFAPVPKQRQRRGLHNEIIEVGAVELDYHGNVMGEFSQFVQTEFTEGVAFPVRELTGISTVDTAMADPLYTVIKRLSDWIGRYSAQIVCWSGTDRRQLLTECQAKHIDLAAFPSDWADLQAFYTSIMDVGSHGRVSLGDAATWSGIEFDESTGHAHSALADARVTAKLLKQMMDGDYRVSPRAQEVRQRWGMGERARMRLSDKCPGSSDLLLKLKAEGVGLLRTPFGLAWQRCKRDSALLFESKRQSV
ncbi:hypothetical protein DXA43_02300 [Collinsella sp. OF02-10]|nr:hypothetical protein DXA43_02300 [Collinsella sp. OF02-10]RHH67835.1 hypothetical protein DW195_09115 [Collinsella sp. AM17-1]